jgi:hypothetical protein
VRAAELLAALLAVPALLAGCSGSGEGTLTGHLDGVGGPYPGTPGPMGARRDGDCRRAERQPHRLDHL